MLAVEPRERGRRPALEAVSERARIGSAVPGRLWGAIWVVWDTTLPCDWARALKEVRMGGITRTKIQGQLTQFWRHNAHLRRGGSGNHGDGPALHTSRLK
jgi:hypothetical protein